jgi:predicted nucleic acid-binding protein
MSIVPTRARYGAVLDANVLVPVALCDTLLRLAGDHFFRPFWSQVILDETERALVEKLGVTPRKARRRVEQMQAAFPDAVVHNVAGYAFGLPDEGDEHVLAAAVRSEAQAIVTFNVADFPATICAKEEIEIIVPDDFLIHQWDFDPERVRSIIYAQVGALRTPVQGLSQVLLALAPHAPSFVRRLTSAIVEDITEFSELLENALSTRDAAVVEVPDRFRPLVDVTLNHGKFV